ncbi:MAG: hypothetical protein ABH896_04895 [Candidatus Jacksonbacteria bacterium]
MPGIPQKSEDVSLKKIEVEDMEMKGEPEGEVIRQVIEKERRQEQIQESEDFAEKLHQTPSTVSQRVLKASDHSQQTALSQKSEFLLQVENILSGGLGDIYNQMEPSIKQRFKNKGEEVARRIERMVAEGKTKVSKIIAWIKEWLKLIPGVNKFFLEQEAKIKADKIISMA